MEGKRTKTSIWDSLENCKQEALKFKAKSEIHKKSRRCFDSIRKNGWDEVCFAHMESKSKHFNYWNSLENCLNFAKKFNRVKDINAASRQCTRSIRIHGWEKECYSHIEKYRVLQTRKSDILNLCFAYKSVNEMYVSSPEIFVRAYQRNLLQQMEDTWGESHLSEEEIKSMIFDYCRKEAQEYSLRWEFNQNSHYAYQIAKDNKWLDTICTHMNVSGNYSKRCIYSATFNDHSAYIGLSGNFERRVSQHLISVYSAVYKYSIKTGLTPSFKMIHDYTDIEEAQRLEKLYYEEYKSAGWNMLNIADTGGLGGRSMVSDDEIMETFLECDTWAYFRECYNRLYQIACKRDKLFTEMKKVHPLEKHDAYSKEEIFNIAHLCSTYREFRFLYSGPYNVALRDGYINEIKQTLSNGSSLVVKTIEEAYELASKCKSMSELRYKSESAATLFRKHKIKYNFKGRRHKDVKTIIIHVNNA